VTAACAAIAALTSGALVVSLCAEPMRAQRLLRKFAEASAATTLSVPVLVIHGAQDSIVLPSMARHAVERCPTAVASWYDGVGHMPFVEAQERFDQELAAFARAGRPSTAMT